MSEWLSGTASSDAQADLREVGDLCYDGYWQTPYLVLAIAKDPDGYMRTVTVLNLAQPNQRWSVGTCDIKTHMTQWDPRHDVIIDHGRQFPGPVTSRREVLTYQDHLDDLRDTCLNWINPKTGRSANNRF